MNNNEDMSLAEQGKFSSNPEVQKRLDFNEKPGESMVDKIKKM